MFGLNISGMNSTFAAAAVDTNKEAIREWNKAYSDILDSTNQQKSFPLIITQPSIYNSQNDSTYISVNPYNPGLITSGFYKDLNKDKHVQKTLTKFYFYKIVDKWIYKELLPLLAFIEIESDKPVLIKSLSEYDVQKLAKDSHDDIKTKVEYMEKIILTKDMVKHVLKKICNENNINWYNLNKYEKKIKNVFYNYILDKLKESIKKYGNNE